MKYHVCSVSDIKKSNYYHELEASPTDSSMNLSIKCALVLEKAWS